MSENEKNEMVVREPAPVQRKLSVDDVAREIEMVMDLMSRVMKKDIHYGVIPGTGSKPSLLKPGAELLGKLFRLRPEYEMAWAYPSESPGHIVVHTKCRLYHVETGLPMGDGVGSCSSLESKYRYRTAERKCPKCDSVAIIKGKKEYGGGWVCFKKKGGCGAKFEDNAPEIITQPRGKVDNPDIADIHNTVEKMSAKRAKIDAILTATAASSLFTQDIEDMNLNGPISVEPEPPPPAEEEENPGPRPVKRPKPGTITEAQKTNLWATANELARMKGEPVKDMMQSVYKVMGIKVESSTELSKEDASRIIDYLENEGAP